VRLFFEVIGSGSFFDSVFFKDDYTSKLKQKSNNLVLITPTQEFYSYYYKEMDAKITPPSQKEDMAEASSSSTGEIIRRRSVPFK
jgi:hypothetical protein